MAGIQWPTIAYIAGHVKPCKFHNNNSILLDYTILITLYTGHYVIFLSVILCISLFLFLFSVILLLFTIHVHIALALYPICFYAFLM